MNNRMPDISYERSMNHNYMILSKCEFFGKDGDKINDFRTRMLLENNIPGLLPVTHRLVNGESRYYYEINSLQSFDRLYDKNEIGYDELKKILIGCVNIFERLEEYLLDGTQIIIQPEMIYINVDKMEPYFVCYPDYEGDVRISFMEFVDGLLTKVNHTDEQAVMLGYQVYRYTRTPNYVISEILNIVGNISTRNEKADELNDEDIRCDMEKTYESQPIYRYENEESEADSDYTEEANSKKRKSGHIKDLVGAVFCVFLSLVIGALIVGIRVYNIIEIDGDSELYLFAAMAMAFVSAVLFAICYIKKRKQEKEISKLNEGEDETDTNIEIDTPVISYRQEHFNYKYEPPKKIETCAETVCLGDETVEERMLMGRINGRDINISLNKLPMTVGKQPSVSDFVINDTAVSKMHARFEEREGRVYICDLNSTNGTVRNGVQLDINKPVALEPGDKIRFGRSCFTYC
jgi:hypothetical protein